jgi:amino acid adenylation domain-containing protein
VPDETVASFRLSPQQAWAWLTSSTPATAVAQGVLRLSGSLDPGRLRSALERVIARHEILRTTFHQQAGLRVPVQVVGDEPTFSWEEIDVPAAGVEAILERERDRPLDLEHGPALRAVLADAGDGDHFLAVALPAISADAGTFEALADELAAVYAGAEAELVEEPLQYPDYAEWQHELAEATDADAVAARAEWQAQRLDELPPLTLPFYGGSDAPGYVAASVELDAQATTAVEAASRALGAAPAAFVLAAWEALLTRVGGRSALPVAVVVDGREDEELRTAMGLLAKPLPVRGVVDVGSPFGDAVRTASRSLEDVGRWQEAVAPPADALPGAAFEWRCEQAPRDAGGLLISVDGCASGDDSPTAKLTVTESGGSLALEVRGAARTLMPADARRLAEGLLALLRDAVARPDAPVSALRILADADFQLLAGLNDTAAELPAVSGIHELFERQAAATPHRPAVIAGTTTLTYAELNARANQLARALRARGVGPDVPVGIFLERSAESIVALVGALKAGGAALQLSVEHPPGRIAHQLRESAAAVVVTSGHFADRVPAWHRSVIRLDRDRDAIAAESTANLVAQTTLENLAYVIYTSGSTGLPKGVAVSHRGIVNYACDMRRRLELEDGEPRHFALVSSTVTDLGNTCVYPSLISGGCLHVIPETTAMDGALYGAYADRQPIDILKITPSHLAALLATGDERSVLPRRRLVLGGESAPRELVDRVLAAGSCRVLNHYGPTETTVGSLTFPIEAGAGDAPRPAKVPIGRPISNTEVLVVDHAGQPVPIGVPGELCIAGAGLARGYIGRPEQTAERFVEHPLRAGERVYRTGDLARHLPDGTVEFLGRVDRQMKIRGFRVEPAEIEAALRRHSGVGQATVVLREDTPGDQRLVAYFVPNGGPAADAKQLRAIAEEQVPDYMVPSAFVALDALPLTANGKLDVEALPAPDLARSNGGTPYESPRDETEEQLAQIWTEVLGIESVGVNDDFFELGGHSLLATQVIARVRSGLGVQLPLHTLFTTPTVAGLAAAVRDEGAAAAASDEQSLSELLDELESLSDEEARELLSREAEQTPE